MPKTLYSTGKVLTRIISLFGLLSWFAIYPSVSQTVNSTTFNSFAEKIYLQLDGRVYTTDQIVWFKSIVVSSIDHVPSALTGVLYVELVGPDERIADKKLIKLEKGIGEGCFELNKSFDEGTYQVRAYTGWNRNFGTDFICREYIQLFSSSAKVTSDPIGEITLIKENHKEIHVRATLNPIAIDSLHKKEVTLVVILDNRKDTLAVKKNGESKYLVDYPVTDNSQLVTLQMRTRNKFTYTKTVALDEDHFDLQFFPEGGELVHGLRSRVGFKAVDYNGRGKIVEGVIVNGNGDVIVPFKSNRLGMGSFLLGNADSTTKYFAQLSSLSENKLSLLYPLPKVVCQGNVMSVSKYQDDIRIKISSNYLRNDSINLLIACRGVVYYEIKDRLKVGSVVFALPADSLPEGIVACTLMDDKMHPLAERLYFNERPGSRVNIAIAPDKSSYAQRELTKLAIGTTDSKGEAVYTNLSLLVMNKAQLGQLQHRRENILSGLLLHSELKGEIEDPGYYFSSDTTRQSDLDDLMLTQGWSKYLYTNTERSFTFQPEPALRVSGTVSGIFSGKNKKVSELTLMTFGKIRSVQTQRTDSLGRFRFNVGDEYGQNLNILVQSANKRGEKKNYTITLDKQISPPVSFNHARSVEKADSVVHAIVEKSIVRKKVDDTYKLSAGEILLGEVVVEAYKMTPERKKVIEAYGEPGMIISGKSIQDKEEKWSYGLYSVLMFNFPDKVIVRRARDGNLYARVRQSEMTLVVIDGIPVLYYDYPQIPNIPPGEVKSFEIIEGAKNFSSLYMETYPQANPAYVPVWGDVIAIYTYAGQGIYGAKSTTGLLKAVVPVFAPHREFYVPKYENIQPEEWYKPDLRALVHWDPIITTDSSGKAFASFYNADNLGDMLVVVEAISDEGEIGYQELIYHVEKNAGNKEIH